MPRASGSGIKRSVAGANRLAFFYTTLHSDIFVRSERVPCTISGSAYYLKSTLIKGGISDTDKQICSQKKF